MPGDLRKDRPRSLSHVRGAGQDRRAPVVQEADDRVGRAGGRRRLDADRDPAPAPLGQRVAPADPVGRPAHGLLPVAVGRRITRAADDLLAPASQVSEPNLEPVDAQPSGRLVHLGFECPRHLRRAEAAQRRGRRRIGEQGADVDARVGHPVWPAGQVAALRDDPMADIGVCAEHSVDLDVLEGDRPVVHESTADRDLEGRGADGLERLLEGQHEAHRSAGAKRQDGEQRLVLGVLLAAEPAAGIRREDPDAREGQVDGVRDEPLQHVRMLDRAPDRDAAAVRRCHEAVRLDREVRGGCGGVPLLDDVIGVSGRHVTPAEPPLGQGVRVTERIVRGTQLRLADEGRLTVAGRRDREHRRQLLVLDPDEPGGLPRGVECLGQHGSHRLPVVLGLAAGEQGSIGIARPEAGNRLRQIGRGDDGPHSGHAHGLGRVDCADASAGTVEMDELHVERVVDGAGRQRIAVLR